MGSRPRVRSRLSHILMIMMPRPLGELSVETFLATYWQKRPLLIRNAFPDMRAPLSGEALAGLACEPQVESRLVVYHAAVDRWDVHHGPFEEETFTSLPEAPWTLLVQAVDFWVPEAAQLLAQFQFLPNWRVDDVMMSYSSNAGGVGPHFDHYDVFLVQAQGRRRWEVGERCDSSTPCRTDTALNILAEWSPETVWELEPGDLLYLPPTVGHAGVALEDGCMTCSIGFRAPSHGEMMRGYGDDLAERMSEALRYVDSDLAPQANPGLMSQAALHKVTQILRRYAEDTERTAEWFGRYMTAPKYADVVETRESSADELRRHLQEGCCLHRNEGSRFAYQERGDRLWFFADGHCYPVDGALRTLIETLCRELTVDADLCVRSPEHLEFICALVNQGSLFVSDAPSDGR